MDFAFQIVLPDLISCVITGDVLRWYNGGSLLDGLIHRSSELAEPVERDARTSRYFLAKVNMKPCDYQILEYTNSELRTHGVPFIVVLRIHLQDSFALTGYVLRNWEAKIEAASKSELDDVEDFLEDLRHHSRTAQTSGSSFFGRLDNLSVGPIRAFVSG